MFSVFRTLVFPFNIPGITELRFSSQILADVFIGTVKRWDHPSIVALNPNITLPKETIRVVARLDPSKHTELLTGGLSTMSLSWYLTRGKFDSPQISQNLTWSQTWKRSTSDMFFVKKTAGLAAVVGSLPYTIGYVHAPMAVEWNLPVISIVYNLDYFNLTGDAYEKAKAYMAWINFWVDVLMENGTQNVIQSDQNFWGSASYPFFTLSYVVFNSTISSPEYCKQLVELLLFINWILTDPLAKQLTLEMDLVPLSDKATKLIQTMILPNLTCASQKVYDIVRSLIVKNNQVNDTVTESSMPVINKSTLIEIIIPVIVVLICLIGLYFTIRRYRLRRIVNAKNWMISEHEIKFMDGDKRLSLYSLRKNSDKTVPEENKIKTKVWEFHCLTSCRYRGKDVLLFKSGCIRNPLTYKFETSKRLYNLRKSIKSPNVADMMGLLVQNGIIYHAYENPGKGSLHEIMAFAPYDLNEDIKYMLAKDVTNGVLYLHKHGVLHGLLDTWNILLDNNWTAKVANWAHNTCADFEGDTYLMIPLPHNFDDLTDDETYKRLLYRHPDVLLGKAPFFEPKHDLYSFAMILAEIFTRETPYQEAAEVAGGWKQVFDEILENRKIPFSRPDIPSAIKDLVQQLTRTNPQISFEGVLMYLTMHQPTNKGIIDTLLEAMEHYMQNLEEKVCRFLYDF